MLLCKRVSSQVSARGRVQGRDDENKRQEYRPREKERQRKKKLHTKSASSHPIHGLHKGNEGVVFIHIGTNTNGDLKRDINESISRKRGERAREKESNQRIVEEMILQ